MERVISKTSYFTTNYISYIHESNPLSAFSVKLLSLIDNDNDDTDDDDDRQLLREWSFNDVESSDNDNIPTLRMRIASNVHRSGNKSKRSNNNNTTNKVEEDNDYSSVYYMHCKSWVPSIVRSWSGELSSCSTFLWLDM